MSVRAQEIRLFPMLEKEFPRLAESYRENLAALACENCPKLRWYDDDSGHLFFRFDLDIPALFILSEPLSRFMAYKKYIIPIDEERNFYTNLGIIPAYFGNLHRISCIDLWGTQASDFFEPYSRPLRGEEDIARRLDPTTSKPSQFSSMNFVLKGGAIENDIPQPIRTALSDYFKYAFWSFPRAGFACSAHIIRSRTTIKHVLKVAKGLYIIRKIHKPRVEWLAPYYSAWVQRVELEVPSERFKTFWVYMSRDIVRKIEGEVGSKDYRTLFINGLVYEFKDKVYRPHTRGLRLLSVISEFPSTDVEVFKTLTGMSIAEHFYLNPETFGSIGTVNQLRTTIEKKYRPYSHRIKESGSLFSMLGGPLEFILDELFPLVVYEGQLVYFVHPIILSALLKLGREDLIQERDSATLVKFIKLLDKMRTIKSMSELNLLRLTDETEHLKKLGIYFSDLRRVLLSTSRWIRLSKLLARYF